MSFKIAIIGAGSLVFARTLFTDMMSVPEFHDIEVAFTGYQSGQSGEGDPSVPA